MFGLVVRFHLRPDAGESFDALVAETIEGIRSGEPGTLTYAVHHMQGVADARVFYELYADRAAFDAHEAQQHVIRFLAERQQYLSRAPEVSFLDLAPELSKVDW